MNYFCTAATRSASFICHNVKSGWSPPRMPDATFTFVQRTWIDYNNKSPFAKKKLNCWIWKWEILTRMIDLNSLLCLRWFGLAWNSPRCRNWRRNKKLALACSIIYEAHSGVQKRRLEMKRAAWKLVLSAQVEPKTDQLRVAPFSHYSWPIKGDSRLTFYIL